MARAARRAKTYRGKYIMVGIWIVLIAAYTMSTIRGSSAHEKDTYAATQAARQKALAKQNMGAAEKANPEVVVFPAYPFKGNTREPVVIYTGKTEDLANLTKGSLGGMRDGGGNTDQGNTDTGVGSTLQGPSGGDSGNGGNNAGDTGNGGNSGNGAGSNGNGNGNGNAPNGGNNAGGSGFDLGEGDENLGAPGGDTADSRRAVEEFITSYTNYDAGTITYQQFADSIKGVSDDTRREILAQAKSNWARLAQDKVVSTGSLVGAPKKMSGNVWQVTVNLDERGQRTSKQKKVTYTVTTTKQGAATVVHSVTAN